MDLREMKTCTKCQQPLPLAAFYRDRSRRDGLRHQCRSCHAVYGRSDAGREVQHKYQRSETGKTIMRAYQQSEAGKEAQRKYARSELGRSTQARLRLNFPEKAKARAALGQAVRSGKIIRPETCSQCGETGKIYGHHHDYSKPLDVEWLCRGCHSKEHREAA